MDLNWKKIENVIEKRMIYKKYFENKNKKKGKIKIANTYINIT